MTAPVDLKEPREAALSIWRAQPHRMQDRVNQDRSGVTGSKGRLQGGQGSSKESVNKIREREVCVHELVASLTRHAG